MKTNPLCFIIISILLLGCDNSDKIEFKGVLGNDLKSRFILKQSGDKFEGYFYYENNLSEKIQVSGVKNGESLRIEEFNNDLNKLTGVFEGKYNGEVYEGYWMNPRRTNRVPFSYRVESNSKTLKSLEEESDSDKKVVIQYEEKVSDGWQFFEQLEAKINGKTYKIIDFETDGIFIKIIDVRDFDNDGYDDALIEETCGGTACPTRSLLFCTYDADNKNFIATDPFGSMVDDPKISKWKDKWSVDITSVGAMYKASEKYILKNGTAKRIEYNETTKLKALLEILPDDFNEYEKVNEKIVKYDLDNDGEMDSIIGRYWDRWNSITQWEIRFADGKSYKGDGATSRIGVLRNKTNGVHDLVIELDHVLIWSNNGYIDK